MKKSILAFVAVAVIAGGLFLLPKDTSAYRGDPSVKGPNYTEDRHDAMEKAFENKDYEAWKTLMQGRGRVTQIVTKDNFAKFAEAHELAEQGKMAEANQIRADLGLGIGSGNGIGRGMGGGCRLGN